jgi:hypothetical protein
VDPGRPADARAFSEDAPSRPGLATLYIYRPAEEFGKAVWPEVHLNDQKIVGLRNQGYTVVYARPGKYVVRTEKSAALSGMGNIPGEFEIPEPGTYFLLLDRSYTGSTDYSGSFIPSVRTNYERWVLVPRRQALPHISQCYFLAPYLDIVGP